MVRGTRRWIASALRGPWRRRAGATAVDVERFPAAAHAAGSEVVLTPGEVLYLPAMWWHEVLTDGAPEKQQVEKQRRRARTEVASDVDEELFAMV